jgi:hypothetical protein
MINTSLFHFLFAGFSREATLQSPKPNLPLIMTDDLRTDLESYGVKVARLNLTQINQSQSRLNL